MTIEQLERFEKYYLPDNELLPDDLDFVISNISNRNRHYISHKEQNINTRKEYSILDYFCIYSKCDTTDSGKSYRKYLISARGRIIEYEKEKYQTECIDYTDRIFDPKGNINNHTITIGENMFLIDDPITYNFLIILLKWSDSKYISGEFPVKNIINAHPLLIPDEIQSKYALNTDIESPIPICFGYGKYNVIDKYHLSPEKSVSGILCFCVRTHRDSCVSIKEVELKSYYYMGPQPQIIVLTSPYRQNDERPINMPHQSYSFYQMNNIDLFGNSETFKIYVLDKTRSTETLELNLFSERDYYTVAAWLIVALSHYNLPTFEKEETIKRYWPSCPLFSQDSTVANEKHSSKQEISSTNSNTTITITTSYTSYDSSNKTSSAVLSDSETTNDTSTDKSMEELQSLIGLDSIKRDVADLVNLVKIQQMRKTRGMKSVPVSLHLVFTGNPGTGKTTVARILGQLYKEIGVLKKGQMIEVDRSDLVAGYVGQTALKTQDKIQEAIGGILFIDEAYTLAKEGNDYGQEAIDTILKAMEDNRDEFIVIVAGYDEPMQKFINSNPGLKSRFNKYFHFPDYSSYELIEIFKKMILEYDYSITDQAMKEVAVKITEMENNKDKSFANARNVRNYFEQIIVRQATRVSTLSNPTDKQILEITKQDV